MTDKNTPDLFDQMLEETIQEQAQHDLASPETDTSTSAPAQSAVDDLLSNPFDNEAQSTAPSHSFDLSKAQLQAQKKVTSEKLIERLSPHRQSQAQDLAKQIDEENMQAIIAYGANAQKKLSEFSRSILQDVQFKDTGDISDSLTDLMSQLQASRPADLTSKPSLFSKLFGKIRQNITQTQMQYQKIGANIDKVAIKLDREKDELLNDNLMLEQFYQRNKDYFEALNVYIAAGEVKMAELQETIIPQAIQKAKQSQNQMDIQKVNDLNQFLDRLDKRTHDLRLTRQMTLQQAPQLRLIQNTNQVLAEKIQSSIHTAIPLWQNQVTIALALLRQQQASHSQRMVSKTTNDLLLKNSEMLKQSTVDVAREAERGVIDLDTLKQTQANLVGAIEETLEIQETGRMQRRMAEEELLAMEHELQDKLLMISNEQKKRQQSQPEA